MSPAAAQPKLATKPEPKARPVEPALRPGSEAAATPRPVAVPAHAEPSAPELPAYARKAPEGDAAQGRPLDSVRRQRFEASFGQDLSGVRVHFNAGDRIQQLSSGAQAVSVGSNIYLKQAIPNAEYDELLAHELTHVVQQGEARGATSTPADRAHDPLEHEAQRNVLDFRRGRSLSVSHSAPAARPQAEEEQSRGWFYDLVVAAVPSLKPILDRGFFNWISDRVSEVASAVMDAIRGPLDTIRGIENTVSTHVTKLIDWIKKCVAALAKGDCSVLKEGIDYIEQVIDGLTAPAFEMLKSAFEKVSAFFNGLWERFGAPLWTKIKDYAGAVWSKIEQFFGWVREKIQPIIDRVLIGWNKVKSWLGIGDDPDSQNGLLQWAQRKLEALWDKVKAKLEPIKKPLLVVAGILVMLSPAGPFIAIGAIIGGVIEAVRWIRRTFSMPNGVVSMRDMLQKVILPKMISGITAVAAFLADKARTVLGGLRGITQKLDEAAVAVADSVVSFLAGPIQFVSGLFARLVGWADEKLNDFVNWVAQTATRFAGFLTTIVDALEEIAHVIRDIMRIVGLLMGRLWNKIPACIRDPFVDFLGQQILGRIPIFQAIAGTPEAWAQTKAEVKDIIHTIFFDFDLIGAMKKVFRLMLRVLNVPMELLTAVLNKMALAWDTIKEKPVDFLKNLLKTMMLALKGFFKNILTHLGHGIVGWLTSQLQGTGVQLPTDWTDIGQIFGFVASVLGLSINHVCELLERRGLTTIANVVRTGARLLAEAWDWIVLIVHGDFAAFWQKVKEKLNNLKEMIIQGIVDWIIEEVVSAVMAQLVTTADPTGISEAIMLIVDTYRTIKTVVQYMRQILEMVQRGLDAILNIASGVLQPAADLIEQAMDMGMPVVIGFLANLAGIGNAGQKIKDTIKKIRDKVDDAILWLIDKAKAVFQAVAGAVGAVRDWWRERFSTKVGDQSHTITVHGQGADAEIYIESTPERVYDFLNRLDGNSKSDKKVIAHIRSQLAKIERLKQGTMSQEKGADIAEAMSDIADKLKSVLPGGNEIPESVVDHDPITVAGSTVGRWMKAEPLSMRSPHDPTWRGSAPSFEGPFFAAVNRRPYRYVQGHLLNHNLFGPGQNFNLVPIHRELNAQMSGECEETVKEHVLSQNKVVSYEVTVNFGTWSPRSKYIPEENELPKSISLKAHEMEKKKDKAGDQPEDWKLGAQLFSRRIDNVREPDVPPGGAQRLKRVNLNSKAAKAQEAFQDVYGIGPAKAAVLYGKSRYDKLQDVIDDLGLPGDVRGRWTSPDHPTVSLTGDIEWE